MVKLPLVDRLRLDKWLWAARLYKTRALAADEVGLGRVRVNGGPAKAGRELKAGDVLQWRCEGVWRSATVLALSPVRGPAALAHALYEEAADSLAALAAAREQRRLAGDPGGTPTPGRPTKRDRRQLDASRERWQRWSASVDAPLNPSKPPPGGPRSAG